MRVDQPYKVLLSVIVLLTVWSFHPGWASQQVIQYNITSGELNPERPPSPSDPVTHTEAVSWTGTDVQRSQHSVSIPIGRTGVKLNEKPIINKPTIEKFRVRVNLEDEAQVQIAQEAGLTEAKQGDYVYEISPAIVSQLRSYGINATIVGGVTKFSVIYDSGEEPTYTSEADDPIPLDTGIIPLGSGNVDMYIEDNTGTAQAYQLSNPIAPAGAAVTLLEYRTRIADEGDGFFYCQDYELWLYSGAPAFELCVYDNLGGQTDGGNDDDVEDDSDIYLNWRTTDFFNGEDPNQTWGIVCWDNLSGNDGVMNYIEFMVHWEASCPDLTPYQKSGWNDKIPIGVSQLPGADPHSYTGPYYSNQVLYFNWACLNQGDDSASGFTVHFEVTGTGGGSWSWPGLSLDPGWSTYLTNDQAVGPLSVGSHTFKLWVDYTDVVSDECDENNNYYERTIEVIPLSSCDIEISQLVYDTDVCYQYGVLNLNALARNAGNVNCDNVEIHFYLSDNDIFSLGDFYICSDYVNLYPGTSDWYRCSVTPSDILCLSPGTWYLFVFIPSENEAWGWGTWVLDIIDCGGPFGEIHGSKWNDLDGDGVWDDGEPGLENWKIYLDENANGQWDSGELYDLTDSSGDYSFADLEAGIYVVAEFLQLGWRQTYPSGSPGAALGLGGPTTYGDMLTSEELEQIEIMEINSPPLPPPGIESTIVFSIPQSAVMLSEVPTSRWTFGCSATSAGMIFGYYDRTGFFDMYTGPANEGVAPLTDLGQGIEATPIPGSCSIIATQNGFDGRTVRGHVDDYWIDYREPGPDPWEGNWPEHIWEGCTADYVGTNQWKWDLDPWWPNGDGIIDLNDDGGTLLFCCNNSNPLFDFVPPERMGLPATALCHGLRLFAESRGYTVEENYTQHIDTLYPGGFSFADYMAEINAGRPVMIYVTNHSIVGVGYDEPTQTVYLHDTWDNNVHSMIWGGDYAGMDHQCVTVIHLAGGQAGTHTVTLDPGEIVNDINFGNHQAYYDPGDANGDGSINVQDVICIINVILDTGTASGNPDCNEDGNVNVQDVICVINKILGG